jgi:hypothetical protein
VRGEGEGEGEGGEGEGGEEREERRGSEAIQKMHCVKI